MGIKDNFSQAMKELINPKESGKEQKQPEVKDVASYMNDTAQPASASSQPAPDTGSASVPNENSSQGQNVQNAQNAQGEQFSGQFGQNNAQFNQNTQQFGQNTQQFNQNAQQFGQNQNNFNNGFGGSFTHPLNDGFGGGSGENSETTVISKNTIIDGNIRSFADMKIDGNIKGNVETTKNVSVNGKIIGNITCDNAVMKSSSIQGNINLKGQVSMASDSMLIGDLTSQVASLNGKIKGNLNISGKAQLDRDSVVFGDIKAGTISIQDGAIIQGYVSTTYLSKEESSNIFPESIAIGE